MPEQPHDSSSPTSIPSKAGQLGPAERLGDVQVHQPELVRLRDHVGRVGLVLVVLGRLRADLLLGELARERAQLALLRRQRERDAAGDAGLHRRHALSLVRLTSQSIQSRRRSARGQVELRSYSACAATTRLQSRSRSAGPDVVERKVEHVDEGLVPLGPGLDDRLRGGIRTEAGKDEARGGRRRPSSPGAGRPQPSRSPTRVRSRGTRASLRSPPCPHARPGSPCRRSSPPRPGRSASRPVPPPRGASDTGTGPCGTCRRAGAAARAGPRPGRRRPSTPRPGTSRAAAPRPSAPDGRPVARAGSRSVRCTPPTCRVTRYPSARRRAEKAPFRW